MGHVSWVPPLTKSQSQTMFMSNLTGRLHSHSEKKNRQGKQLYVYVLCRLHSRLFRTHSSEKRFVWGSEQWTCHVRDTSWNTRGQGQHTEQKGNKKRLVSTRWSERTFHYLRLMSPVGCCLMLRSVLHSMHSGATVPCSLLDAPCPILFVVGHVLGGRNQIPTHLVSGFGVVFRKTRPLSEKGSAGFLSFSLRYFEDDPASKQGWWRTWLWRARVSHRARRIQSGVGEKFLRAFEGTWRGKHIHVLRKENSEWKEARPVCKMPQGRKDSVSQIEIKASVDP